MWTNQKVIERKTAPQLVMHPIQLAARLVAARKSGLVGCDNQQKAGCLQFAQRRFGGLENLEFLQGQRRNLLFGPGTNLIQDRISFNKHCSLHNCTKAYSWPNIVN